jgi:excisionase family DNA binding protein
MKVAASTAVRPFVDDDAYLTPTQVSTYSGISRRNLDRFMRRPLQPLPFYRVGRNVLIRRSEFDAWMRRFRHDEDQTVRLNNEIDDLLKGL